ncbi:N-acetylmuramoyl-L-alanine amidase [Oceanobacillus bengalensis]|uniref:N-acetylmuramoyl-L-alanine amidase n=1 Tax=Oceanobacillus bengalensis TaxID=1435466 RepID=A0A494Z5U3_9BACI|nr:N-acetylmuramoyl-L-alanine amidase [Oceanobacillus bengalensis]RKQ17910.1 N-acetylmuramoyl-L-alanine amidase [Oceanobacillus bengalensis]
MHIKKRFIIIFSIFLIAISFSITAFASEVVINVDNLNIRSGPGTEYATVGQANAEETYPFIQQEQDWVEVELEEGTGWINVEFLTVNNDTVEVNEPDENNQEIQTTSITIQADNTHLRSGPSTDYNITHFADKGEQFEVISQKDQWYELENENTTGFILKDIIADDLEGYNEFNFMNKTIIIDAGHGGHDVGAIGASGTFEKDFTYFTAQELEKELTALGANVLLTRPGDEFISLNARASFSNISNTDAFISIHYNSFTEQPNVTGIETFYYHDQNKDLARYVQEEMIKATNANNRGYEFGDLYVLRQNFKPAVLVELGFISNGESEAKLRTKAYQQQLVQGMVNGLSRYFSSY